MQQAQHHRFAVHHRDDRNAHVDFFPLQTEFDPPVLGQPLLGNVQVAEEIGRASCRERV
jgi:hypothetical protein